MFCVRHESRNSCATSMIQSECSAQVGKINTCSALKIEKWPIRGGRRIALEITEARHMTGQ